MDDPLGQALVPDQSNAKGSHGTMRLTFMQVSINFVRIVPVVDTPDKEGLEFGAYYLLHVCIMVLDNWEFQDRDNGVYVFHRRNGRIPDLVPILLVNSIDESLSYLGLEEKRVQKEVTTLKVEEVVATNAKVDKGWGKLAKLKKEEVIDGGAKVIDAEAAKEPEAKVNAAQVGDQQDNSPPRIILKSVLRYL
ncbi:hypothetical protein Acr_15g0002130 [Actinidia rufa]|uniref:Uncharacterized protein n=1 Tax=Actinidia rufa TaxID=165716 RepID=A0A7J0FSR7_9ERIC|nr:hypothetical protein Acr_15g0002130 [Actinidia rufa]